MGQLFQAVTGAINRKKGRSPDAHKSTLYCGRDMGQTKEKVKLKNAKYIIWCGARVRVLVKVLMVNEACLTIHKTEI